MRRALPWLLGAGALGAGALVVWWWRGGGAAPGGVTGGDVRGDWPTRWTDGPGARVEYAERANGCLPPVRALLPLWQRVGHFPVYVPVSGGLRATDAEQLALAVGGASAAYNLRATPHGPRVWDDGRAQYVGAAAIDLHPVSFRPYIAGTWDKVPTEVRRQFHVLALFYEANGLDAGARWRSDTFPNGDNPHGQMKGWAHLPFGGGNVV